MIQASECESWLRIFETSAHTVVHRDIVTLIVCLSAVGFFAACGQVGGQALVESDTSSLADGAVAADGMSTSDMAGDSASRDLSVRPVDPIVWDDSLKDGWIEPEPGECDSATVRAFVQYTADGDTLDLTNGERVRLLGVSASELGGNECWSQAAKDSLIALAPKGSEVCLLPDQQADNKDRYDRLLRYVFVQHVADSRWVLANARQVRIGYAQAYTSFLWGLRYRNEIVAAEFEARTEDIGGWPACGWQPK